MSNLLLEHLARGTFNFVRPEPEELAKAIPGYEQLLPVPQKIFLSDEAATPLSGFPILRTPGLQAMDEAFEDYLSAEEESHYAYHNRQPFDSRLYASRWERYRELLATATENLAVSSYGQRFPSVFWLHHSMHIARCLKLVPKRLLRFDLKLGRELGDQIKYKIFFKFIDRAITLTYDLCQRLAAETDEKEDILFPTLLSRMRDNVLIFTEDHISRDLSELASYFNGCLKIESREFRRRFRALEEWHEWSLSRNRNLRNVTDNLLGGLASEGNPSRLLTQPGYVRFLASLLDYDHEKLFTPEQVQVWEGLLMKLKEFEILHALRRMVVPLEEEEDGTLFSRDRSVNTTWVGGPPVLHVSEATRPIDFMAPWVVDPQVQRYGLVYDITQFSAILSMLGRREVSALDNAFRMMFRFQRRINRLAFALRLRLEKYLGDGAFYSGRHARRMMVVAVHLQRLYVQFLEQGLPFDRGLRIAINYSRYRLLPLEMGSEKARYEFFGHGIVELSRLATGKASQEIDEMKNFLVGTGYPPQAVEKFFAPMVRRDLELVARQDEQRRFYAYINHNGTLINEGIVATEDFIRRLESFDEMYYAREHGRGYIAVPVEEEVGGRILIGIRKLGMSRFKGLEQIPVYEIIDGDHWNEKELKQITQMDLLGALERLFSAVRTAQFEAQGKAAQRSRHPTH